MVTRHSSGRSRSKPSHPCSTWIRYSFGLRSFRRLLYVFLGVALYSWITLPITSMNVILTPLCPIPLHWSLNFLINYVGAVNIYLYIIGAVRSFSLVRLGYMQFTLRILGTLATIPFVVVCEITAVLWGLFSDKGKFYVVEKRLKPLDHV